MFDIVDSGGAATRQVRVGDSLVTFPVWAFASGSTPGSTARVVFPAGYRVDVASGDMPAATTAADGTVVLQTERLESPLTFFAFLVADRAGATIDRTVEASVGGTTVPLTISAWSDDVAWADRVGDLAARALPILAERTGLGWARDGGLAIRETIGRSSGGYAGLFDPATGEIEVAYDASDEVVLHEAAHSWFNGSLLADRWANEAFASYYARAAAPDLAVTVAAADTDTLTPELEVARIPLNAWGALGAEARATEDFGYAASLILARTIGERVGDDGLKAVWAAAASRTGAYQPSAAGGTDGSAQAPETVDAPPDWRGLLDLLDEHATTSLDDAWRTWVARDDDLALLDARRAARSRYAAVVASAGDWPLPRPLRDAMRAWRFDDANRLMTAAEALLAQRATIAARASASGLTLPETLRTAFAGPDGFTAAANEAAAELEAIDQYDAAVAARAPSTDIFEDIGLWGTSPVGRPRRGPDAVRGGRPLRGGHLGRQRRLGLVERGRHRTGPRDQPRSPAARGDRRRGPRRGLVSRATTGGTWHDDRGRHRRLIRDGSAARSPLMTAPLLGRPRRLRDDAGRRASRPACSRARSSSVRSLRRPTSSAWRSRRPTGSTRRSAPSTSSSTSRRPTRSPTRRRRTTGTTRRPSSSRRRRDRSGRRPTAPAWT